ncbi:MAG: DegV family protein [Candidatus Electrothrix sp. Rat3]|nr:DegV family protein [Candidatus Electrothrix rattekaaiensis]
MPDLRTCFAAGYACLAAWANLLDRINVFPVADGDTGTNLRISLAPLRDTEQDRTATPSLLTRCAIGNSGNIAAAFFREFCLTEQVADLAERAASGREKAWQAVAEPCKGTMLSVFDSLAACLAAHAASSERSEPTSIYPHLRSELQEAVRSTPEHLPDLKKAGVVDAGALGMYIYFDGFFRALTQQEDQPNSILSVFAGQLDIRNSFLSSRPSNAINSTGTITTKTCCANAVLRREGQGGGSGNPGDTMTVAHAINAIKALGESVVVLEDENQLKVHIHTDNPEQLRRKLAAFGTVISWDAEEIKENQGTSSQGRSQESEMLSVTHPALHILTDAAGSMTRKTAAQHGITLLDSYIIAGDDVRPESLCEPAEIYSRQRKGGKVTTAQASSFERYQYYESLVRQFGPCLYLCVGSAFTGNFAAARAWKKAHDSDNLLTVLDTGTASGCLALIALLTAQYTQKNRTPEEMITYACTVMEKCREYVFIDELKYLVAGGRVSKAGGFFGDLFGVKPIVSPINNIVQKLGITRNRKGQLTFALEKLQEEAVGSTPPLILLQYSDNEQWVRETVQQQVRELLPKAKILLTPLSLSSGVHMGPGTWAIAFAPQDF